MKKNMAYVLALPLLVAILILTFGHDKIFANDNQLPDDCTEAIVSAINEQNGQELKSLFSPNALKESEDLDKQIDARLERFK